jgi:hypothetical protein
MSEPTLSEKVLAFVECLPKQPEVGPFAARVVRRIETDGAVAYVMPDGTERHVQASAIEEARNFCEEIEDALAYAANAHYMGGDARWRAVAPLLAILWEIARATIADAQAPGPPAEVIAFPSPDTGPEGAA